MKKILLIIGFIAFLTTMSCSPKKENKEEEDKFAVTNPIRIDTSFTKEYVSQIRSVRDIEIRALEKGFLQNSYVDEGQYVHQGQLLFRIMPKLYEAELLKAKSEAQGKRL